MGIILPICAVTGRIAGDRFACGDCDPCMSAHVVPPVVKRLMAERDEFADKYEDAMCELDMPSELQEEAELLEHEAEDLRYGKLPPA